MNIQTIINELLPYFDEKSINRKQLELNLNRLIIEKEGIIDFYISFIGVKKTEIVDIFILNQYYIQNYVITETGYEYFLYEPKDINGIEINKYDNIIVLKMYFGVTSLRLHDDEKKEPEITRFIRKIMEVKRGKV